MPRIDPPRPSQPFGRTSIMLDKSEVQQLATLMRELRELTPSRRTFAATTAFLRRFAGELNGPTQVAEESSDSKP